MNNKIASILRVIGIIIIIAGIIVGVYFGVELLDWLMFLQWSVLGLVPGMLLIGFAEIIELLHKIAIKLGVQHPVSVEVKSEEVKSDM